MAELPPSPRGEGGAGGANYVPVSFIPLTLHFVCKKACIAMILFTTQVLTNMYV